MVGASAPLRAAADRVYLSEGGAGRARPAPESLEYAKFTDSEYGTGPAGQSDHEPEERGSNQRKEGQV